MAISEVDKTPAQKAEKLRVEKTMFSKKSEPDSRSVTYVQSLFYEPDTVDPSLPDVILATEELTEKDIFIVLAKDDAMKRGDRSVSIFPSTESAPNFNAKLGEYLMSLTTTATDDDKPIDLSSIE